MKRVLIVRVFTISYSSCWWDAPFTFHWKTQNLQIKITPTTFVRYWILLFWRKGILCSFIWNNFYAFSTETKLKRMVQSRLNCFYRILCLNFCHYHSQMVLQNVMHRECSCLVISYMYLWLISGKQSLARMCENDVDMLVQAMIRNKNVSKVFVSQETLAIAVFAHVQTLKPVWVCSAVEPHLSSSSFKLFLSSIPCVNLIRKQLCRRCSNTPLWRTKSIP